MFRTEALCGVVCAFTLVASTASAQTIGELAEAQRAKLRMELASKNAPPADATPAPQPVVKVSPVAIEPPKLRVHSLYQRNGHWIAEITNGSQLAIPIPGMVYGKFVLEAVDGQGLHFNRVAKCARAKACESKRLVRLGGEF